MGKIFVASVFFVWLIIELRFLIKTVNGIKGIDVRHLDDMNNESSSDVLSKTEYFQNILYGSENDTRKGATWGFCDPFKSPVHVKRAAIPELNMTMFFLGCSFNERTQKLLLTVFMEPVPPNLPVSIGNLHAVQSKNWSHARVTVQLAWDKFDCDLPVWRASAISTFECRPPKSNLSQIIYTGKRINVHVWTGNETTKSKKPVELSICRKGPIKQEVALCMPYLPSAGPDWSTYIRQYIEYHKLAGVSSIAMFDHTRKYERLIKDYYPNDKSVVRVQWPPLSSEPDKVISAFRYETVNLTRECYDQTLLTTYYMVNTDYAWVMVLDSDEYFWDEYFAELHGEIRPPLIQRLNDECKDCSCVGLETTVLLGNTTLYRPFGDQSGIVIEDNDWVCPINSYLKVACKSDEVYGMEIHVASAKRRKTDSSVLRNLHIKNIWMTRVQPNFTECIHTDRYYKPFSKDLREILKQTLI